MRGHEFVSNLHRISVLNQVANRRSRARSEGQPRLGDAAGAVFGGPPIVFKVLDVLIGDFDCDGLGYSLENLS